jgi:hypothetical protein
MTLDQKKPRPAARVAFDRMIRAIQSKVPPGQAPTAGAVQKAAVVLVTRLLLDIRCLERVLRAEQAELRVVKAKNERMRAILLRVAADQLKELGDD